MKAGCAEVDITPPVGTHKIGWLKVIVSETVLDPLHAKAVVFDDGTNRIGIIQLDTLSIRWTQVNDIRKRIENACGFPGNHIMVSATHNHAGPAVSATGMVKRDNKYVEFLTERCVQAFLEAFEKREPAVIGFGATANFEVGKNRRVVMRDGTVKTHGNFLDPDALYVEGPVDPEVAVIAVSNMSGEPTCCIVNYACHPTHYGGGPELSAGYPGAISREMAARGWPVTLFLNGASGNIHTTNTVDGSDMSADDAGKSLAGSAAAVIEELGFSADWRFAAGTESLNLPYREFGDEEMRGEIRGAQRFVDPAIYDTLMPRLVDRIRTRKVQPAEVQVLSFAPSKDADSIAICGIPAEYFVEFGLRIKSESPAGCHALVTAHTNGMVGYVPTREAFERGGYETTLNVSSRMAPEAGDLFADAALRVLRSLAGDRR